MSISKLCPRCKQVMGLSYFYSIGNKPSVYCKLCQKQYTREYVSRNKIKANEASKLWQLNNPEKYKSKILARLYGMTLDKYNDLLEKQNFCCGICKRNRSEFKRDFAVDHCHKTGNVRGLLCRSCNLLLGNSKDDKEILSSAIEYLSK